jgi:hypothetical protein
MIVDLGFDLFERPLDCAAVDFAGVAFLDASAAVTLGKRSVFLDLVFSIRDPALLFLSHRLQFLIAFPTSQNEVTREGRILHIAQVAGNESGGLSEF